MGGSQLSRQSQDAVQMCTGLLREEAHPNCWGLIVRRQELMSPVSHVLALILISLDWDCPRGILGSSNLLSPGTPTVCIPDWFGSLSPNTKLPY